MILDLTLARYAVEAITAERRGNTERGVVVLHSIAEVESVCAARILMAILASKHIDYSLYPVESHAVLVEKCHEVFTGSTEARTAVFINCGATRFVGEILGSIPGCANVRCLVVDSHRPIDPQFDSPSDNVNLLLLGEDEGVAVGEEDWPGYSELDLVTDEDLDDLRAAAEEEQDKENAREFSPSKRARTGEGGSSSSREARDRVAAVVARRRQLDAYWQRGSYYGTPTPLVLLKLAEVMHVGITNQLLWPAIVGVTDQLVHQRTNMKRYLEWRQQLNGHLHSIPLNAEAAAELQQAEAEGGGVRGGVAAGYSQCTVLPTDDLRLQLLRHWNLYDALLHSPLVAARLQTFRQGGLTRLAQLLSEMGIPLAAAKQPYDSMDHRLRSSLFSRLQVGVARAAISWEELVLPSFAAHYGYNWSASASDAVAVLGGLLVLPYCSRPGQEAALSPEAAFWEALKALDVGRGPCREAFQRGLDQAQLLAKATLQDGGLLVSDKKVMLNLHKTLRHCIMHDAIASNKHMWHHPLAVSRLALFVRDCDDVARRALGKRHRPPMVFVGPVGEDGFCCALGLRNRLDPEARYQHNPFGYVFRNVLRGDPDQVVVVCDEEGEPFDDAVTRVAAASLGTFRIHLSQQMDALAGAGGAGGGRGQGGGAGALGEELQQMLAGHAQAAAAAAAAAEGLASQQQQAEEEEGAGSDQQQQQQQQPADEEVLEDEDVELPVGPADSGDAV